jgi:hypothetical protein
LPALPFGAQADQSGNTYNKKEGDANPRDESLSIHAPHDLPDFPDERVPCVPCLLLDSFAIEGHNEMIVPNSGAGHYEEYEDVIHDELRKFS